jgi:hypothetical protein
MGRKACQKIFVGPQRKEKTHRITWESGWYCYWRQPRGRSHVIEQARLTPDTHHHTP